MGAPPLHLGAEASAPEATAAQPAMVGGATGQFLGKQPTPAQDLQPQTGQLSCSGHPEVQLLCTLPAPKALRTVSLCCKFCRSKVTAIP